MNTARASQHPMTNAAYIGFSGGLKWEQILCRMAAVLSADWP